MGGPNRVKRRPQDRSASLKNPKNAENVERMAECSEGKRRKKSMTFVDNETFPICAIAFEHQTPADLGLSGTAAPRCVPEWLVVARRARFGGTCQGA